MPETVTVVPPPITPPVPPMPAELPVKVLPKTVNVVLFSHHAPPNPYALPPAELPIKVLPERVIVVEPLRKAPPPPLPLKMLPVTATGPAMLLTKERGAGQ